MAVFSDSAASCLVTLSEDSPYEIFGFNQKIDPEMLQINKSENVSDYLIGMAAGVKQTLIGAMENIGKTSQDFKYLITNNYNFSVLRMFSSQAGRPPRNLYTIIIGKYAHAFAADNLMNLCDLTDEAPPEKEELISITATEPNSWGISFLRKT